MQASLGLTISLDPYLEHQSYDTPTDSEYAMRRGPSTEESYPVSPLPKVTFLTHK